MCPHGSSLCPARTDLSGTLWEKWSTEFCRRRWLEYKTTTLTHHHRSKGILYTEGHLGFIFGYQTIPTIVFKTGNPLGPSCWPKLKANPGSNQKRNLTSRRRFLFWQLVRPRCKQARLERRHWGIKDGSTTPCPGLLGQACLLPSLYN